MEERHKQRHETRAERHGQKHGYRVYDLRYPSPVRARGVSNFAASAGNLVSHATFDVLLQVGIPESELRRSFADNIH